MWKGIAAKVDRRRALVWGTALLLAALTLAVAALLYERSQLLYERSQSEERAQSSVGVSEEERESVALYAQALEAVNENYVDPEVIEPEEQTYGAIKGMLDSLGDERHTRFLTPEEVEKTRKALSNKIVTTGVRPEDRGDEVVALTPITGSPAEEAGIEPGDVLIEVNGEGIQGSIVEAAERLNGAEGSTAEVIVRRGGEEREFSLERVELEVPAASWHLISGTDVAHLRLALFSENSAAELEGAITEAREAGAERFVLDLRNNSGGRVNQTEQTAAQFLPAQSTIYVRRKANDEVREETVPEGYQPLESPLVVLVNRESASGAEIHAGALRDNDRAEVAGETTFGTGTVLDEYPLSDGSTILLAIAEWLTPNGDTIRETGIEPDVVARLEEGQKPRTPDEIRGLSGEEISSEDAQLGGAFEVLQNR